MIFPPWLLGIGSFFKGLPWQVYAAIGVLVLCGASYCTGERYGRSEERAAWEAQVAEIRAEREALAVKVEELDEALAIQVAATITQRRQELDDVTANLPDQELSARQCARIDSELRRAGRGRELPPSCAAKLGSGAE